MWARTTRPKSGMRPLPTWMKAMDLGNRAYLSSSLTVTVTRP